MLSDAQIRYGTLETMMKGEKKIKTRVRLNSMEPKLQNIILSYHQRDEMF